MTPPSVTRAVLLFAICSLSLACSKPSPPKPEAKTAPARSASRDAPSAPSAPPAPSRAPAADAKDPPLPEGAAPCVAEAGALAIPCTRFASADAAFRWILAFEPAVVGVGEAHAQRGTEQIPSATKRFTERLLPILAPRASDVIVEAWAGDPRCARKVEHVAKTQAPIKQAQAASNPNEYVALGTKAKALGVTPWLLRPTCDDYAALADAGADVIPASLALIRRLTLADATKFYRRNLEALLPRADARAPAPKVVVTYGGAMHNDLIPDEALRPYTFGPALRDLTHDRYLEVDLIVPEYVKSTPAWKKLPWYTTFERAGARPDRATVLRTGPRSFVLVFPKMSFRR